jgi:hypothetical protein
MTGRKKTGGFTDAPHSGRALPWGNALFLVGIMLWSGFRELEAA